MNNEFHYIYIMFSVPYLFILYTHTQNAVVVVDYYLIVVNWLIAPVILVNIVDHWLIVINHTPVVF